MFNAQQMELPPLTFSLNFGNLKSVDNFLFFKFHLKEIPSVPLKAVQNILSLKRTCLKFVENFLKFLRDNWRHLGCFKKQAYAVRLGKDGIPEIDCVRPHRESEQSQEKQAEGPVHWASLVEEGQSRNCISIYKSQV